MLYQYFPLWDWNCTPVSIHLSGTAWWRPWYPWEHNLACLKFIQNRRNCKVLEFLVRYTGDISGYCQRITMKMFRATSPVSSPPGRIGRPPPAGFWSSAIWAKNGWSPATSQIWHLCRTSTYSINLRNSTGKAKKNQREQLNNGNMIFHDFVL